MESKIDFMNYKLFTVVGIICMVLVAVIANAVKTRAIHTAMVAGLRDVTQQIEMFRYDHAEGHNTMK